MWISPPNPHLLQTSTSGIFPTNFVLLSIAPLNKGGWGDLSHNMGHSEQSEESIYTQAVISLASKRLRWIALNARNLSLFFLKSPPIPLFLSKRGKDSEQTTSIPPLWCKEGVGGRFYTQSVILSEWEESIYTQAVISKCSILREIFL